jgi:hypothetical protein
MILEVEFVIKHKLGSIVECLIEKNLIPLVKIGSKIHQNDGSWIILNIGRWWYFMDDGRTHESISFLVKQETGISSDPVPGDVELVL